MLTKADWAAIKKENGEHLKNEFLEEAKRTKRSWESYYVKTSILLRCFWLLRRWQKRMFTPMEDSEIWTAPFGRCLGTID